MHYRTKDNQEMHSNENIIFDLVMTKCYRLPVACAVKEVLHAIHEGVTHATRHERVCKVARHDEL